MSKEIVKKSEVNEDGDMPFLDHLEELRWTILKCVVAVVIACVLVGIFVVPFNDFLMYPFLTAEHNYGQDVPDPRVKSALAPFFVMIEIAFFGGLFIALPFVLYFIGKFISPAFTKKERGVLLPGIFICVALFSTGVLMSFFWMMPIFFEFSFRVCEMFNWEILYDLEAYYSYVVWMPLACGLSFQMPLIMFVLIYLEVLSPEFLRKNWRIIFVVILVASAILTPSDPLTMFLLAIPLYMLYELALLFGTKALKKKIAKRKQEEEEFDREGRQMYESYRDSVERDYQKSLEQIESDEQELEKRYNDVDFRADPNENSANYTPYSEEDDPRIVDSVATPPSENSQKSDSKNGDKLAGVAAGVAESLVFDDEDDSQLSLREIDARIAKSKPFTSEDFLKKPDKKSDEEMADGGLEIYMQAEEEAKAKMQDEDAYLDAQLGSSQGEFEFSSSVEEPQIEPENKSNSSEEAEQTSPENSEKAESAKGEESKNSENSQK